MKQQKNPSVLRLLKNLLTADIDQLQGLLSGTEAETLMSRKTEKTAISIKAVLATYLKCLSYLHDESDSFSVRRWVEQTDNASWLFISSTGNKHASLRPMITAWLDIAINALLSLTVNPNRRIWLLLDELPSLQKMPYLKSGLAEARKFGGCFVIGIQSYADLEEIYGVSGSRGLSSLLNTRFMFRVPDPELARWSSRNLGEMTYDITQEGISYGANTLRDGVSLSRQERTKPVVSVSDIQHLPNLQCYVRLPGQYPVTQLTVPWIARAAMSPPLIPRPLSTPDLRQDIHQLADDIIASAPPLETMTQGKAQQDAAAIADIVLDI